ncbi:MAG: RpiB/LacA/LacB family sugar-phosphate isomerase [Herpetosiphonaceae bacterium]|nr:RpiB/LacA/LacB family sugar-phosphate isomerase [Herpetosiphonaceae bacterium]
MTHYILALGADAAGTALKNTLRDRLQNDSRVTVRDFGDVGPEVDYPHVGIAVAEAIARGEVDRAVLICGTGIGMAISANKVPGVRATVAHDSYSVERSILSNNCQVLTLGARVIGVELASRLVHEWLGYEFDPGSASAPKVDAISAYETCGRVVSDEAEGCLPVVPSVCAP